METFQIQNKSDEAPYKHIKAKIRQRAFYRNKQVKHGKNGAETQIRNNFYNAVAERILQTEKNVVNHSACGSARSADEEYEKLLRRH